MAHKLVKFAEKFADKFAAKSAMKLTLGCGTPSFGYVLASH